jgi:hypothetical protein
MFLGVPRRVDRAAPAPARDAPVRGGVAGLVGADWQSLSLFRIMFAVYLIGDFVANDLGYFRDFYGADGILPLAALAEVLDKTGAGPLMPLLRLAAPLATPGVFAPLYLGALLAVAVGYRTRIAGAGAFVLNGYVYWRNPQIDSGAEVLAHLLLLWCLFLPMGRYWSVDGALDPQPRDRPDAALPLIAIRLQIASLYLFAALFKLAGAAWRDGTALEKTLGDNLFGTTPAGLFLIDHAPTLLHATSYLVVAFQLAFPFLIYCPWRNPPVRAVALIGAALMHVSFIVFLNIGGFPYLCLAMLVLLVPDAWIDRLLAPGRARLARIAVYYEPDCGFCQRIALILRELLLTAASPVEPASADPEAHRLLAAHGSWVVRGADGAIHLKWRAVAFLLKQHPLLAPLGWLTDAAPARAAMARLYDRIGASRHRLGPLARHALPFASSRPLGRPARLVCGALMVLALFSNVSSVLRLSTDRLRPLDRAIATLQIGQSWSLFAPVPTDWVRTFHITLRAADGATSDLIARADPSLMRRDARGRLVFASDRWLKYFAQLDILSEPEWRGLGGYLCRRARAVVPDAESVEVTEFRRRPFDAAAASNPRPVHQRRFPCA